MPRPPGVVVLVARTHWVVGGVMLATVALLSFLVRNMPVVFETKTYVITLGGSTLYLLAGTLVWFGTPFGRVLSKICGLIYLVRPQLGSRLWKIMESPEYQAHFSRTKPGVNSEARKP